MAPSEDPPCKGPKGCVRRADNALLCGGVAFADTGSFLEQ